ncbi:Dimerisation domain-containing protein [Actinopolyspora mzabensis]|uniref:Dimerisation domain-containing protein n=1 Tax=Actinopolyspora mzabensis TaxID=995066 RepID=A0A1G9EGL5_ACTMZ|nr:class I SAM-dependent methyltransferase [Actinopolyspora mzabensis]SDK75282.1 Dimerisation domain-containing protein [Actinopolyspora mzabensis]
MVEQTPQTEASAQWIVEDLWAAREAQVLIAGTELDVFTHIFRGARSAEEVATAIGAPIRGVERLLDALVGIEYLDKQDGHYTLSSLADKLLVRDKDTYVGEMVQEMKLLWNSWSNLTEVIRTGEPVQPWDDEETGRRLFPSLVRALFPMSWGSARAAAAVALEADDRVERILDVAAGSGVWSIAFAQQAPRARVTTVDYSEVTPLTREFAERYGVVDRFDHIEGNLRDIDFGAESYDLAILGYILQTEGEDRSRDLLEKCHRALRPGGRLLIAEMIPDDDRTGPAAPLVYAMDMVLYTEHGDVFTMTQYRDWLHTAGFRRVETIDIPAPWPLVLATK